MSSQRADAKAEPFDSLLLRLGADGEAAEQVYERLRARLIALFRVHLPIDAEVLTDETLERLARRLHEGVVVEHVPAYLHGIARLVLLEARARPLDRRVSVEVLDRLPAEAPNDDDEDLEARAALRRCLNKLGAESARLILGYYGHGGGDQDEGRIKARQALAATHGLNLNALRNRALRLRATLEACVRNTLARDGKGRNDTQDS